MSGDGLFRITDGTLTAMRVTPYDAEHVLQDLVAQHPDLLAGGQMTPEEPRRWALVRQEQGVPDEAGMRWSVDHLFVDQDAVPTLVEVKRSSDTRIRREVVGQMLDYAANGVRYWPVETLRAEFERTHDDPEGVLAALVADGIGYDEFFQRVGDNLRAGRIRMVFVADLVPDELQRIVEFLNEQMDPAEVFAVEVKTYQGGDSDERVMVPAVFGRTAAASMKGATRGPGDRAAALAKATLEALEASRRLGALAEELDLVVRESRTGDHVETAERQAVTAVYYGSYNVVEFWLGRYRELGWPDVDEVAGLLQTMTSKRLAQQYLNVPAQDALAHWATVEDVVRRMVAFLREA